MNSTRKLPQTLTADGRASRGGEHLVPSLAMPRQNVFVGVKSGKKFAKGYLVYLGPRDVGTDEILNKLGMTATATEVDRAALNSFLQGLQQFKIGNVVSFAFVSPDLCVITKEADRPVSESNGRLP